MDFADVFSRLLDERNISSYRFARDFGVADSVVSYWRSGGKVPQMDNMKRIAEYFGVTIDYLMGVDTEGKKNPPSEEEIRFALGGGERVCIKRTV